MQDLEAILLSKPARLNVESLAIWQDYVGRELARGAPGSAGPDVAEVEDAEEGICGYDIYIYVSIWVTF